MKNLAFLFLLAFTKTAFCQNAKQDTTLVYNSPMYTKDPLRSKWTPTVKRVGDLYQVTFFDKKNTAQEVISFEDKDLQVRKGEYIRYNGDKPKEKGTYDKGYKHGGWLSYNIDGSIKKSEHFYYGKLDGEFAEYWNSSNQIKEQGKYETGRKIGLWKLFYLDGKLAGEENYDVYGKKEKSSYFHKNGERAEYEDLFAPPSYQGGINEFYRFLGTKIQYPRASYSNRIEGTVKLSFTVKKDGSVEEIEVVSAPNAELGDEASRVLSMSRNWIPGKQFGEEVNVKYNIPIKFSLRR
jgi:TonB family protein